MSTQAETRKKWNAIFNKPEVNVLIALIALSIFVAFASPFFLTPRNLINITRQFSLIAILAIGQGLIILTGGIDLSVGSAVGFTAVFAAWLARTTGAGPEVTLFSMLSMGAAVGLFNGILVTKVGVPPFIATLGTMSILRGLALLMTFGVPIPYPETWISVFGGGAIGIIPVSVVVMITIVISGIIFSKNTTFGKNIYAVGNNEKAAKLSGIRVGGVRMLVFCITGVLAAVCGLILMGQMDGSDTFYGTGMELDVIAASVIGGISLSGGKGNLAGVVVGAALMGVLKNAFILLAVPGYWQTVAIGVITIGAVAFDSFRKRKV